MDIDPTRMCELLVGLDDVEMLGIDDLDPGHLVVVVSPREERLGHRGEAKLAGLLRAGDPRGEVAYAWHAKEAVRFLYDIPNPQLAGRYLDELAADIQDTEFPPEVRSLGRTLTRWRDQVVNWHRARATNSLAEAINNLVKRVKRGAFGFRRFRNYRIRSLLYAGRPNWNLLATITAR